MNNTLLPSGSTQLERNTVEALSDAEALPVALRDLYNPATCPAVLLPYLAWAWSVDYWNYDWPESTKRAVVAAAFDVHRRKGTRAAIRRAIEPLGFAVDIVEWFAARPPAARGTFAMQVNVSNEGISDDIYREVVRLIDETKPVSRHLSSLTIALQTKPAPVHVGVAAYLGDELTIYAYMPSEIVMSAAANVGAGLHIIDEMRI